MSQQLARVKENRVSSKRGGKVILTTDEVFKVKSIDQEKGLIELIDNLNPETIHTLEITAVELFNEGKGIWEQIKVFGKKVKTFFQWLGSLVQKKK